jgi:hypothetical protein
MPQRYARSLWKDPEARARRDQLVLMLRYHTLTPTPTSPVFAGL